MMHIVGGIFLGVAAASFSLAYEVKEVDRDLGKWGMMIGTLAFGVFLKTLQ